MQIGNAEDKVGNSGGISGAFYFDVAVYRFHCHSSVEIVGFDAESVLAEFPKIKTDTDNDRQVRMNAREIT